MFNKKVLAVALAAAFTTSAQAVVDLDATTDQTLTFASENITATVLASGAVDVDDTGAAGALNFTTALGFTIGSGTTKYIRVDLSNASFNGAAGVPNITSTQSPNMGDISVTISAGGAADDEFVIYEVAATAATDIEPAAVVDFDPAGFEIMTDGTAATFSYGLYETAVAAANPGAASSLTLKDAAQQFAVVDSVTTGDFSDATNETATVSSDFTEFDPSTAGGDTLNGSVGQVEAGDLFSATSAVNTDSSPVTALSLLTPDEDYTLRLVGDQSFGTWTLKSGATDCASGAVTATFDADGEIGPLDAATIAGTATHLICVEADGTEQIIKGGYSLELEGDSGTTLTNVIGNINYDTTSIEVPYLTTLDSYNQRVYLVNSGSTDAAYSFSFVSEDEATVTPGTGATGVVPAGEMIAIRASDIATITGRTRTSAVIEVEGVEGNIQAATQTVNLSDGTTDTVVLNANSITAYEMPSN